MGAALSVAGRTSAAESPPEGGIVGFVTDLVEKLGGPGAGIAVALENLFPPIPSELILPLTGFTASQGSFSLVSAIFWTTVGSVVGAVILYYVGAWLGRDRVAALVAKVPLMSVEDVERTEAWFGRHGRKAVFFGRMVPFFRSLISIPAGVERMRLPVFVAYTAAGSLIWNTALILAGYGLGENWRVVETYVGRYQYVVYALFALAIGYFVVSRLRARRQRDETPAS